MNSRGGGGKRGRAGTCFTVLCVLCVRACITAGWPPETKKRPLRARRVSPSAVQRLESPLSKRLAPAQMTHEPVKTKFGCAPLSVQRQRQCQRRVSLRRPLAASTDVSCHAHTVRASASTASCAAQVSCCRGTPGPESAFTIRLPQITSFWLRTGRHSWRVLNWKAYKRTTSSLPGSGNSTSACASFASVRGVRLVACPSTG